FCNFCQFLTGVAIVICGIQNWRYSSRFYHFAHGIWGGTLIMLSASHNLACTIAELTVLEIVRQMFDVLVASLIVPILALLFALEYMSDSYYSHFSDNFYCEGCFSMHWHSKIYEKLDVNSSIDECLQIRLEIQPYEFYSHVMATLKCNEPLVTQLCHPNVQAVTFDVCGFMANAWLFILLVPLNSIKSYYIVGQAFSVCRNVKNFCNWRVVDDRTNL
uniref:Uncharacterized protein n=1 Tax=Romanomermis culicivorax TaxID=13658 RepID=A0A915KHI6_ROMCU